MLYIGYNINHNIYKSICCRLYNVDIYINNDVMLYIYSCYSTVDIYMIMISVVYISYNISVSIIV